MEQSTGHQVQQHTASAMCKAIRDAARKGQASRADHHALGPERAGFPGGRGRGRGEFAPQHRVGSILGGGDEDDLVSSLQPAASRIQLRFAVSNDACTGISQVSR